VPVLLLAASLNATAVPAGSAMVFTYPRDCNSAPTLQDCIDHTSAGDTVEIDTNTPLAGSTPSIEHGLILRAAPGFHPTLRDVNVYGQTTSDPIRVMLRGLTVDNVLVLDNGPVRADPGDVLTSLEHPATCTLIGTGSRRPPPFRGRCGVSPRVDAPSGRLSRP